MHLANVGYKVGIKILDGESDFMAPLGQNNFHCVFIP